MDYDKLARMNELEKKRKMYNLPSGNEPCQKDNSEIKELQKEVRALGFAMQRTSEQLNEIVKKISALESRFEIEKPVQRTFAEPKKERDLNKPIDRNEVAPADVSVEKYFYFGKK